MKRHGILLILLTLIWPLAAIAADSPSTSCVSCHSSEDMFDEDALALVAGFDKGVHAKAGLSCHDCHGGNPDSELAEDMEAMESNDYLGAPDRVDIPAFCARCHSSIDYMRRYNPAARVDQLDEYWTSQHGLALRDGNDKVATCTDCHGVHGIVEISSPESPVYPTRLAETCSNCHSDAEKMKGVKDPHGRPLPVDQYAKWRSSVHADSLLNKGDLFAPTCNDCHGNHGAAPPGVESVAFICGNCHGREAALFTESVKWDAWAGHNEMIEGSSDCADCHDDRGDVPVVRFTDCVTCHENHGVVRPTIAMLGNLPDTPCAICHEASGTLADAYIESEGTLVNYEAARSRLALSAVEQGLEGDERFDWFVDQTLILPEHLAFGADPADSPEALRPEFRNLFEKFRIGKTHYTYVDPVSGEELRTKVRDCQMCHTDSESSAAVVGASMFGDIRELSGMIGSAERTLLRARRGGVEVREANEALEQAVNREIELEVLVHTFSREGAFEEKKNEGLEEAEKALRAGEKSLEELTFRRNGLFVSLFLIGLVLIGLALKIRALGAP